MEARQIISDLLDNIAEDINPMQLSKHMKMAMAEARRFLGDAEEYASEETRFEIIIADWVDSEGKFHHDDSKRMEVTVSADDIDAIWLGELRKGNFVDSVLHDSEDAEMAQLVLDSINEREKIRIVSYSHIAVVTE